LEAGAADVHAIDRARTDDRPAERAGLEQDLRVELGARFGIHLLAVVDALPADGGIEHHRRGDDGTCEGTATRFVDAGDRRTVTRHARFRAGESAPDGQRHEAPLRAALLGETRALTRLATQVVELRAANLR